MASLCFTPNESERSSRLDELRRALEEDATPYVLGGATIHGADCWGVVRMGLAALGLEVPLVSYATDATGCADEFFAGLQQMEGVFARVEDVTPGDVIFFPEEKPSPSGVGIVIDRKWLLTSLPNDGVVCRDWRAAIRANGRATVYRHANLTA